MSVLRAVWSVVLLVLAALPLAAGWSGSVVWAWFAGAVMVAFGAVVAMRAAKVPTELVLFGLTLLSLLSGYFVARGAIVGGPVEVLRDSVPRLLTAARPAPPTVDLLMPGVLLVFLVSVVAAVSMTSGRRAIVGPVAGAVVLYTAGALLTAGRADGNGLVALGLVAVAGVGWVAIDRREAARDRQAPLVPAAVSIVVLSASALLASVIPGREAFEPRELVRPPVTDIAVANPLPRLATWAASPDTELLRLRGPELPVRLVVLADFTGAAWQASSLYGPLGAVAAPDLPPGSRVREVEVEVTVGALDGNWLPTVGRPMATDLSEVMVDPDSGSLVLPAGLSPGLAYELRGMVDDPGDDDLIEAKVPDGPAARRYLDLPGLPFTLAEYARQSAANTRTPYEQAVALEQVVRLNRKPDAEAPVGSSYARVEQFLYGPEGDSGANKGTAEQFATAYAVLGRVVGLPTRVVVGFPPVPEGPDGQRILRGIDVTAWPEVYFTNWGWVPFDPVSGSDSGPSPASKREVLNRLASTTARPPTPDVAAPPLVTPSVQPTSDPNNQRRDQAVWWPFVALAVPVLAVIVLATLRGLRRARLRRSGALGAWAYVLDVLLLAGQTPARHLSAPEIAGGLPGPAVRLAELADRAAFAPGKSMAAPEAWRLARQVRADVRRDVPWYRGLFWGIDPRPLYRTHR
ncbi:MAG: transglutaminase-like domain-containing protein [Actinomycetota bacterium]|nr:transglutaminase-like domain-containing protein [Actinomycetota bacterium]